MKSTHPSYQPGKHRYGTFTKTTPKTHNAPAIAVQCLLVILVNIKYDEVENILVPFAKNGRQCA